MKLNIKGRSTNKQQKIKSYVSQGLTDKKIKEENKSKNKSKKVNANE